LRAQLKSISYNDTAVDLSSNRISFAWFYGYTPNIPAIWGGLQSFASDSRQPSQKQYLEISAPASQAKRWLIRCGDIRQ